MLFLEISDNSPFGPFIDLVVWMYLDRSIYDHLDEAPGENKYRETVPLSKGGVRGLNIAE